MCSIRPDREANPPAGVDTRSRRAPISWTVHDGDGAAGPRSTGLTVGAVTSVPAGAGRAALHEAERILDTARNEPLAEWSAEFDAGALASETALCLRQLADLPEAERVNGEPHSRREHQPVQNDRHAAQADVGA